MSLLYKDGNGKIVAMPSPHADKVKNATAGNFAGLNTAGNLTDSGKKPDDFLAQMPSVVTASAELVGKIIQYAGNDTNDYKNGYFYKCIADETTEPISYKWVQTDVQPDGGGGGDVPIATTETPGIVKPDGTTITVDNDGTIHSISGGSADFPAGGTTGQALVKASDADNDVEWGDMPDASRKEIIISSPSDFRLAGKGSYSFKTSAAVTITLADANTITIPANMQGFFDVGETDTTLNDYIGLIQYTNNGYEKKIYFTKSVFYLPSTDSVQIDDNNVSSATTYSSAKIETAIGSSKAAQMTGATAYQDGKAGLATKPVAGDNQKALFGDGKYHTIYAANTGSVVIATTDESTLYGRPVTLTAGSTTLTGTFSNTGECTFHNLAVYGAVSISSSDQEGNLAKGSTNITYFGTYVVGVGFNFATIKFTSSDISLAGVPVAIYKDDVLVAETSLSIVGSGQLEAVAYVEELGTYRAIARTSNGTARAKITITSLRQTYVVELIDANIYGFQINHLDSNPVTCVQPYNLDDYDVINADFAPAHMDYENDAFDYGSWGALATCDRSQVFFAPKPCMLRYDGTVDYYLNPNDYTKKLDGTASDVADFNYEGNCMIELPTVWFKRWEDGNYSYILIADKQVDIDFHAYAHHDVNGNVMPFIYRAVYDGSYDGTRLRSISGVDCHNTTTLTIDKIMSYTTRLEEMNYAKANNTSTEKGEGWFILHKAEWDYINDILILIGMSTDTQTTFGRGRDSGYSSSSKTGIISTGTMNNKGLFWGENAGAGGVKVLGFENPWGNLFKSCVGWCYVNGIQKIKCTYGTEDSSTVEGYNTDATGYQIISSSSSGVTGSSGGYISGWIYGTFGFIPTIAKGSSSTYRADGLWYASGNKFALVGGSSDYKLLCGATSVSLYNASDVRNWWVGAALSYKGVAS